FKAYGGCGDGGCAALTRPTIEAPSRDVGWVSVAHPPFFPGHNADGKVDGFTPAKKKSAHEGRFPPGAGIAKGAAASPLCTFA
ncbi:hypothetical protein AUM98_21230, partial [Cronobacter sakazakii]